MTDIDVHAVTIKLIGPIAPVGDSRIDKDRLANLKRLIELVDRLLFSIAAVSTNSEDDRASVKEAGRTARKYMDDLGVVE